MTVKSAPMASTRETYAQPFTECGIVMGRSLRNGDEDPTEIALANMISNGRKLGCDAVIAVRLVSYPGTGAYWPMVVAYGTVIK